MRYRRILMDADETIFDFQSANRRAVANLLDELGIDDPNGYDRYQAFNHACWDALERGEMTQDELHVERFRRFLSAMGRDDDPVRVADRFVSLLGSQSILLPNALDAVAQIADAREVIILTNGLTAIQRMRMANSPVRNYISGMVISQEVGVAKPDPAIFALALEGVAPKDALMIGDGVNSDVLGANRAGIDMCWINPNHKTLPDGMHAEYIVDGILDSVPIALRDQDA